jgi:CubicO group peptidase (beta-lactamase class C family)
VRLTLKKILSPVLLFCLIIFLSFVVSPLLSFQAYTHTEATDKVDALFERWDRMDSPGAALGIFQDGRIIYARGYGAANLEYNIPITPQTVFRVGSVSKQFTAMCIALLAEQGKLALDDDIRKLLPEMHADIPPVTIRHMIHHTSGIRDYLVLQALAGRSGGYFYTSPEAIDLLTRQRGLDFKPGDKYSYSNSGYFLLAEIVKRASGMKPREFAKRYIFDPLGMTSTHFHDDINEIVKNRASGYLPIAEGGFRIHMTQLDMIGDGGIYTTVEDFFKWDQNFYKNKLGNETKDLIDLVLTTAQLNDGKKIDYAFGLVVNKYRGFKLISHGGSFVGYKSHYLQFPEQKFSVVILSNLGSFEPDGIAMRMCI